MSRIIKMAVVFLAVVGLAAVTFPIYAQEKTEQGAALVSGEVVSVDLAKSEVAIKQVKDAAAGTYSTATFAVAAETKIAQGDTALTLSDLKAGDKVTVKYATDASGKQIVESIAREAEGASAK